MAVSLWLALFTACVAILLPLLLWRLGRRPAASAEPGPAATAGASPRAAYRHPTELRATLEEPGLLAEAARQKEQGNEMLANGLLDAATQCYLTALWFLRRGSPTYPKALNLQVAPAGEAAASLLGGGRVSPDQPTLGRLSRLIVLLRGGGGGGSGGRGGGDGLDGEAAEALRVALHLNVAAVALRREDWYLAAAACRWVTERQPANAKALYRLGVAQEGTGDSPGALRSLAACVKAEPQNREARRLFEQLRDEAEQRRSLYSGIGGRSGFGGSDAPPPPPPGPEREDELTQRIRALLEKEAKEENEKLRAQADAEAREASGMPPTAREEAMQKARQGAGGEALLK